MSPAVKPRLPADQTTHSTKEQVTYDYATTPTDGKATLIFKQSLETV